MPISFLGETRQIQKKRKESVQASGERKSVRCRGSVWGLLGKH